VPALTAEQVGLAGRGWAEETRCGSTSYEAEVLHDGDRLGPVGGRIIGEVLVGIIDADPESFRSVDPDWTPTLPARRAGAFGLADVRIADKERGGTMAQTVRDVMTENPRSIGTSASVVEAARLMREEDIGSLPITDDETLVGVITDRDITTRVVAEGADPSAT